MTSLPTSLNDAVVAGQRALSVDAPVLVLHDPTTAVDAVTNPIFVG